MASQTGTSPLAALLPSLRKTHEQRKGKEVPQDTGGRLPADINGGVAQLKTLKFSKVKEGGKNAGKLQLYADAVMKEPEATESGQPVRGLLTRIIIPLYDTPERTVKTAAEHFVAVQDLVSRLLGHNNITDDVSPDNIEAAMTDLVQRKPHFGVRTWKGNKQELKQIGGKWFLVNLDKNGNQVGNAIRGPWGNEEAARKACPYAGREPMVNEVWQKVTNYQDNGHIEANATVDNTATIAGTAELATGGSESTETDEVSSEDLDFLVETASGDGGDSEAAQQKLKDVAEELGVNSEDVEGADSWEAVADLIRAAQGTDPGVLEGGDGDQEEQGPEVGSMVKYRPTVVDPKSKKKVKSKKPIDCKILSVDDDNRTVELKDMTKPKTTYKSVGWDDLETD